MIGSIPIVESYTILIVSLINLDYVLVPIRSRGAGMGSSHQIRVSQVHESVGKFPAFYKILQGFRGYLIHITVD